MKESTFYTNDKISTYATIINIKDNSYDIRAASYYYDDRYYDIYDLKYEDVKEAGFELDKIIEKEKNDVTKLQSIIRGHVCRKRCKKIMINKEVDELIQQYCDGFLKDIKLLV